ncbi:MAG: hypothetical protein NTY75_02195 [Candidatus Shapirobacteria bacterium]|nr:hypothetical protein [Candidatus Shapirobacteria bacterium]
MKWLKLDLPDKIFGLDSGLLVIFIPTVVVVVLVILSFGWIISPRIDDYKANQAKITATQGKTKSLMEKINYLKTMDLEQLNKDESLVNNALLPQKNSYLLVNVIRKLSESYNYTVGSFSLSMDGLKEGGQPTGKITSDGFASVPVEVVLLGSADNYVDFISAIEQSLPLMSLTRFEIKKSGTVVELDLTISAYYSAAMAEVDVNKLTLSDLTLNKDEADLIAKIGQFKPIENMQMVEGKLKLDQTFVQYDRKDPFTL